MKPDHRLISAKNSCMGIAILVAVMTMANNTLAQKTQIWQATSRTALAVTGNITVLENRVSFENGKSIFLKPLSKDIHGIYMLDPPANPTLLQGNKLCGNKPPTYILIYQDGQNLFLHVFDGPDKPHPASGMTLQKGVCATYNYEKMG